MKDEFIQILKMKCDIFINLILVPEFTLLLVKKEKFRQDEGSGDCISIIVGRVG